MGEVSVLMAAASAGDRDAGDRAFALVYADPKRLARRQLRAAAPGHGAISLVHEAWLKLARPEAVNVNDRDHLLPASNPGAKRDGAATRIAAKLQMLDEDLQTATLPDLPDLAMETLASDADRLTPGADISVQISVANNGSPRTLTTGECIRLRLFWDTPATRETFYGNIDVPSLPAGRRFEPELQIPVPAAFGDDERQTLRAELLVDNPEAELDGANNAASLTIGGMPVPTGLHALSAPGTRIVNLGWDDPADARVAGYRVWVDDADGQPVAIGSSFNLGFADLSALYGFTRQYRVSTYSDRGIASERSEPLATAPSPAIRAGKTAMLFRDSFE